MVEKNREVGGKHKKYSDEYFLDLYFRYGSVEEALASHDESMPISAANYHRLIVKKGIITSAGRHVSLPETLHFFKEKALEPGQPIEKLYRKMSPSFQTSLSTLHRIYQLVEKETVRRYATALVLTNRDDEILVGKEVFSNSRYGKKTGDLSIPMGFSKKDDTEEDSVLRVLQQEVSTRLAISGLLAKNGDLANKLVSNNLEPFMYLDIVDVRVSVYHLRLSEDNLFASLGSYKLANHRMQNVFELMAAGSTKMRSGVLEILRKFEEYQYGKNIHYQTEVSTALINETLHSFSQASIN